MEGVKVLELQKKVFEYTSSLFHEGFLNDQFKQLRLLQDERNPNFTIEIVTLFFDDSERLLNELTIVLEQNNVDFKKVDARVHQLKGSSSSIGAHRVQNVCVVFRNYCIERNVQECVKCLQQVKRECSLVKNKLKTLFKLEGEVLAAGGSVLS